MGNNMIANTQYQEWLKALKQRVLKTQLKAAVAVNQGLLQFYWELGVEIVEKQKNTQWGSGFLKQLSADLMAEFPDMKGFSKRNLECIRQWFLFYSEELSCSVKDQSPIAQQPVSQIKNSKFQTIFQIPWSHNLQIIQKCETISEALFYVQQTLLNNWSRNVLTHQIESGLYERQGKAITNFDKTLPAPQSDLAQQIIKDPYNFDFLTLTEDYKERELEQGLIQHVTRFLIELGAGFAYLGKQGTLHLDLRENSSFINSIRLGFLRVPFLSYPSSFIGYPCDSFILDSR